MNPKQAGGVAVSGHPPDSARPRQFCYFASKAIRHVPRVAIREFARPASAMLLPLAILVFAASCGSFRLNPDPEVAPSGSFARVWAPSGSISVANEAAPKLAELRTIDESNAPQALSRGGYDLPALVDLALKTNPQTRRAWYAAQAANAQLGQSQAANYPKIAFDGEGGYLKLPIQFPGQTLVVRNEAFLPQIKVSYDLLDFGRTRAAERGSREQLIAANFSFNRAIQDVVFNVEKAYYVLSAAKASVSAADSNLTLARTSLSAVQERHQVGLATHPQILLATQVEAQAVFDLENAKSMVHDAASVLYEAIGVAPDVPIDVQGIDRQNRSAKPGRRCRKTHSRCAQAETRCRRTNCCGPRGRRSDRRRQVGILPGGRGQRELWTDNLELHRQWRSYSEPEPTLLWSAAHASLESLYRIRPLLRRAESDSGTERSALRTKVAGT